MSIDNAKQLFTTVTEDGKLVLSIEPFDVPEPAEHEVVVQMEAVPINPSDLGLLTRARQYGHGAQRRGGWSPGARCRYRSGDAGLFRRA